jgi:hypothetical protein
VLAASRIVGLGRGGSAHLRSKRGAAAGGHPRRRTPSSVPETVAAGKQKPVNQANCAAAAIRADSTG